jgi:hypothetical protein
VRRLAIIGAGPRGTGILERLLANLAARPSAAPLEVHVIDPYPPGAGRVWRYDQSPLMLLNSMARDVTVWTDQSVKMDGPAAPGPTLEEWARRAAPGGVTGPDRPAAPVLSAEAASTTGISFPSRRLQHAYLTWYFAEVVRRAPAGVDVVVHADRAVAVDDLAGPDGTQLVRLESGAEVAVDAVILSLGHLDRDPDGAEEVLADFAAAHDVVYVPPSYTADVDLAALAPGRDVIVRGMGLAFVDLMVLLTEARGGRYRDSDDGRLVYHPSGCEPRLWIGSRRGVPYRAKLTYDLLGGRPDLPRHFSPERTAELVEAARKRPLDFWTDVWPLIGRELSWAYYRELALGHPDRVRMAFADFERRFAEVEWASPAMAALVAEAVPDPSDHLSIPRLDRPLAGRRWDDADDLEADIVGHIEADVARRADTRHSADLGLFAATLSVMGNLPRVVASRSLTTRSRVEDVDGWWWSFFSYYSSGPPPERLRQLLALHRAGVVRFVGPDMTVEADPHTGRFVATSPASPRTVTADALVDARLPKASVGRSQDPLVRALHARGDIGEEVLTDGGTGDGFRYRSGYLTVQPKTMQVLDGAGRPHPRRFALGANTSSGRGGAFARPGTNALAFRQNDAAARVVLDRLAAIDDDVLVD